MTSSLIPNTLIKPISSSFIGSSMTLSSARKS